jgi:hypothetical protein
LLQSVYLGLEINSLSKTSIAKGVGVTVGVLVGTFVDVAVAVGGTGVAEGGTGVALGGTVVAVAGVGGVGGMAG